MARSLATTAFPTRSFGSIAAPVQTQLFFWGFACSAKLRMDRGMGEDGTRATSQPMFVWAESSSVSKVSPFSVDAG